MKKTLLIIVLCVLSGSLFAESPVNFGIHGGLVNTSMDVVKKPSFSKLKENSKDGMMLGVFLRINLNKWYIQPELNYVNREGQIDFTFPLSYVNKEENYTADVSLHSLDVPLLLGRKIIRLPFIKLRAYGGPVASFMVSNDLSVNAITDAANDIKKTKFESAVWNAKIGAGLDIWKLTFDIDYEMGITDVSKNSLLELRKNKMINMTVGIKLF